MLRDLSLFDLFTVYLRTPGSHEVTGVDYLFLKSCLFPRGTKKIAFHSAWKERSGPAWCNGQRTPARYATGAQGCAQAARMPTSQALLTLPPNSVLRNIRKSQPNLLPLLLKNFQLFEGPIKNKTQFGMFHRPVIKICGVTARFNY